MSFFKHRSKRNAGEEANSSTTQAQSIDSLRKSARHRLIGATVLVLVSVIGFPLIFDTQPRPVKTDIQIEIADHERVKPSDPPAPIKSPSSTKANASEESKNSKNDVADDKF